MPSNVASTNPIARLFKPDLSRDLFRVLADTTDDALIVLSGDAGRLLTCNHAFLLISEYARSDVEGMDLTLLFPGEPGQRVAVGLRSSTPHRETILEDTLLERRSSGPLEVDLRAVAVGAARSAIVARLRPSAQRRTADEQDQAQRARLSALGGMAAALEADAADSSARVLALARDLLGCDVVGMYRLSPTAPEYLRVGDLPASFPSSLPPAQLEPLRQESTWMIGQRPSHPIHKAARAAGLAALQAATIGEPDAWIGVAFAGWKAAEQVPQEAAALLGLVASLSHAALRLAGLAAQATAQAAEGGQAGRELEAVFGVAAEAFLTLDRDLRVRRCNQAAADLLGYQPVELINLPVNDLLISPDDLTATLLDAAGHRRVGERPQLILHRRDGTPFPAHIRVAPIEHGEEVYLAVSIQDLSEREALAGQSEVLSQRAILGEVSAIFAHEVRNPINNISTGIQLVASRLGEQHPLYPSLDRVHKECNRLDQLMRDVLLFARPLELKMEPVDLAGMVEMLLQRWRPRLGQAQIRPHAELQPSLPKVPADPRAMEQVLVNLISNAIQAMPDGGTLSVRLSSKPATASSEMVELQIADTGPGIPADQVARIFDPFFTTKKDGTGLGLAISRRIVAAHKGSIQAESYPGAGTLFTVRLPSGPPAGHGKGR
ncbi:MAG: ATP-binding protein [Anaerolineales bacterium]|nr:ATP-binding protein [Anaerolineales bacterium]